MRGKFFCHQFPISWLQYNEEFEATNEELQATNEELETNNEELQATNEELQTTNDELTARTVELQELTKRNRVDQLQISTLLERSATATLWAYP